MPLYEIVPHLYLGDFNSVQDECPSDAFIINCTKELPILKNHDSLRIPVDDDVSDPQHPIFVLFYFGCSDIGASKKSRSLKI